MTAVTPVERWRTAPLKHRLETLKKLRHQVSKYATEVQDARHYGNDGALARAMARFATWQGLLEQAEAWEREPE